MWRQTGGTFARLKGKGGVWEASAGDRNGGVEASQERHGKESDMHSFVLEKVEEG